MIEGLKVAGWLFLLGVLGVIWVVTWLPAKVHQLAAYHIGID